MEFSPDSFEKQETNFQKNISNTEYSLDKFENKKSNNVIQSPKKCAEDIEKITKRLIPLYFDQKMTGYKRIDRELFK